jgi:hypothetical protein
MSQIPEQVLDSCPAEVVEVPPIRQFPQEELIYFLSKDALKQGDRNKPIRLNPMNISFVLFRQPDLDFGASASKGAADFRG